MSEINIAVGNQLNVGKVSVNPREIRGVGGWYNPSLHIPVDIYFHPRKKGEQIALTRITASLHLTEIKDTSNQLSMQISYDQINNMPNRSTISSYKGGVQLLFPITHEQIKLLEDLRHKQNSALYLHLEPIIARLETNEQSYLTLGDHPVSTGLQSILSYYWQGSIGMLRIDMAEMKWTENILPGIGYDQYRLVEVSLPTSNVLIPISAIEYFNNAKKAYDIGNIQESLQAARFVLEEIEKHLKVHQYQTDKQNHRLGTAIAAKLEWSNEKEAEQTKFLNSSWHGVYTLTNAANHTPSVKSLLPADAHAALLLLATLLEYIGQIH